MRWLCKAVLAAAPRLLWWALGASVVGGLNLAARQEIWPNTPQAEPASGMLVAAGALGLLLTGPVLLWRLADVLPWLVLRAGVRVAALLAALVALPLALFALWMLIGAAGKIIAWG